MSHQSPVVTSGVKLTELKSMNQLLYEDWKSAPRLILLLRISEYKVLHISQLCFTESFENNMAKITSDRSLARYHVHATATWDQF